MKRYLSLVRTFKSFLSLSFKPVVPDHKILNHVGDMNPRQLSTTGLKPGIFHCQEKHNLRRGLGKLESRGWGAKQRQKEETNTDFL